MQGSPEHPRKGVDGGLGGNNKHLTGVDTTLFVYKAVSSTVLIPIVHGWAVVIGIKTRGKYYSESST